MVVVIIITVVIALVLLFVIVNFPQICIAGICLNLIPIDLRLQVKFWLLFVSWIILQVLFVFAYVQLGRLFLIAIRRGRGLLDRIVRFSDELFRNV